MLSSRRSPFDNLPHVGHLIIGEAFIAPVIEAVGVNIPSRALLIIVRVSFGCIVSLIVKTLPEATHPPGRAGLSVFTPWGWWLVYRYQHHLAFMRQRVREGDCRESPLLSLHPFGGWFIIGVSELRPHVASQLGSQAGDLLLIILQVLVLGLTLVNQPHILVAQFLVLVFELIELLRSVLELTCKVSIVLDEGQG
jgi:hypothetical protein